MDDKRGLGRGLSMIFQELQQQQSLEQNAAAVDLPIEQVAPNPNQPRKYFDEQALDELRASIAREGVLQPILVRKVVSADRETYQIIAGERRWRASKLANRATIPAVVIECDDSSALQLGLVENMQRDDLSPLEEATSIWTLVHEFGQKQEEIATLLSKSRSYVSNSLRLLRLPESVQELIRQRKITAGHARALIDAEDPEALARQIVENNLSVREVERAVRPQKPARPRAPKNPGLTVKSFQRFEETSAERDPDLIALEEAFAAFFHVPARIFPMGDGGVVQLSFKDYNVLDDIMNLLKTAHRTTEDETEDALSSAKQAEAGVLFRE